MATHSLKAISLFTGVGGLDYGFEAADFQITVGIEVDPVACRTIQRNRPNWKVINQDIRCVSSSEILQAAGLQPEEADVLIGGPVCQPFSKSSYWLSGDTARLEDVRAHTLTAFLRVLRDTKPKTFLLENVDGLVYKGKDEGMRFLLDGIASINQEAQTNYASCWKLLNTAHYGVPQTRRRLFLIGSRDGRRFEFPPPTHGVPTSRHEPGNLQPFRTSWDAIGDLPARPNEPSIEVGGKWGALLPSIPEGENYLWHTNRKGGLPLFGWRTRYWSFLLKLAKNRPAWTIQAQPGSATGPFHWTNRKLTSRELCRIQTLPEDLEFSCGHNSVQRMLGNAVPSLLAEVLAKEIRRQFFRDHRVFGVPKMMPPIRTPVPAPEPITSVPSEFMGLVGVHPDHPGEGRLSRSRRTGAETPTKSISTSDSFRPA